MRKYFFTSILLCLLSVFIISCDSVTYNCTENNTSSSWSMSYAKFDGCKSKVITIDKASTLNFDITSYEGTISVIIENEVDDILYESDDITTSSFEVPIQNPGKYDLIIEAKDHNGSFNISW